MEVQASIQDVPLGAVLTCSMAKVPVTWGPDTKLVLARDIILNTSQCISRHLARINEHLHLYPSNILHRTEVDHWLTLSSSNVDNATDFISFIQYLNDALAPATYLVAKEVSIADYEVFASLYKNGEWKELVSGNKAPSNVLRWYNMILVQVGDILSSLPADVQSAIESQHNSRNKQGETAATKHKKEQGGKFVELPGAKMGEVVVRFPPEASGYLHIGHAKAALLNQYYQQAFKGKLIMRFDDTNPEKEKENYEKVILEDLKLLDIQPDVFTHSSDQFDRMIEMCETLIMEGLAYADDTDAATMKKEREERKESVNRNNAVEKNMKMWMEMKMGTEFGQTWCIRAKIDMQSPNGCMRDPTIYRCKNEPHVKTGTKYRVYPTYDFACPIVDSVEGVTHALRTTEYHDRDEQYFWFIEKLKLRSVHIYEYSRLNMNNTVLSKRKLTWFVDNGLVDGWDDPRFPTVRGILRRGMTVEGLKDFIIAQGSSRSVVNMEWDKIWAFNKKVIDRVAPRYTALESDLVPVNLPGVKEIATQVPKHPKDTSIGTKCVWQGPKVFIESVDAKELKEGQNATFINWGNILIKKIHQKDGKVIAVDGEPNLSNTDYKKTLKLTWLAETNSASFIPVVCVDFDHLINKDVLGKEEDFKNFIGHKTRFEKRMIGDPELKNIKVGDIIQLQRKGFYRCDETYEEVSLSSCKEKPIVLFSIPDGHTKESPSAIKKTRVSAKEKAKSAEGKKAEKSPQVESKPLVDENKVIALLNEIQKEGDNVRKLKADKADKNVIMAAVDTLKARKKEFQNITGIEWKAGMDAKQCVSSAVTQTTAPSCCTDLKALHGRIVEQGNTIRQLKSAKADKNAIKNQVDILLALKEDFKGVSNVEWKPDIDIEAIVSSAGSAPVDMKLNNSDVQGLHSKIQEQGNKVRQLKASNADKAAVKMEVDILLALKKEFKGVSGIEWKPDIDISQIVASTPAALKGASVGETDPRAITLKNQIDEQGAKVRTLKESKASKGEVDENVKKLLQLKAEYKKLTGLDLAGGKGKGPSKGKENKHPQEKKAAVEGKEDEGTGLKKQTRLGLEALKEENLSEWYSQVITKSEMIEYYNVSGCYILRPWSYGIWDFIKDFFDKEIKKLGVENAYFPIFVSKDALEKEKEHIEDFSPEVAWVTRSGSSEMAEPVAIRPTSETVMYPAYAKWIQSHRDLPLRLNQWNNVVRWEFKQPTPFLRTREFLWQEGHTAFATQEEALKEVSEILDLYAQIYTSLLAVPVVKGRKTNKEKFAGGDFTLTTEAFISASGRGIQGATSHHLGQNFSKMIDIVFEDPETKQKKYVYQNSWGITTRTVGVMVMVHGDNKGLVLPPRVALLQAIIMPVGITAKTTKEEKDKLISACKALEEELKKDDIRVQSDFRDHVTPAWKFNHWELKGVPLRLELGPREVAQGQVFAVRRDTGEKKALTRDTAVKNVKDLLEEIHKDMFSRAKADLDSHIVKVHDWKAFTLGLDSGNLLLAPFCGGEDCEDAIKKDSARDQVTEPGTPSMGAKSLCIPFEQPDGMTGKRCIYPQCQQPPQAYTLFGRSY